MACDERDVGECLDVLDERGAAAHPPLEWTRRRERGLARPAVQPLDERCLLAGDEAVGDGGELDSLTLAALADGRGNAA